MRTIFYTTGEGEKFIPVRTAGTMTQIRKGLRRGLLVLPERTVKFFAVLLPTGEIFDILSGYRDRSNYHPALTSFSGKKVFRTVYRALLFSGQVSVIGGKLGAAQRLLKPCRCGCMPVIDVRSDGGPEHIQVCCDFMTCTVMCYNPEFYTLKQAARCWNKKGRFLYNQRIKDRKINFDLVYPKSISEMSSEESPERMMPQGEFLVYQESSENWSITKQG